MIRWRPPAWLMALMLAVVTIGLYWPAIGHDFINYDDDVHITSNVHVQQGLTLESIGWALGNAVNCNWHPLTVWSHMLDCQFFGLRPWGHHLTNVLLHALNAVFVFVLLEQMTGARWRSLLVAVLFSVHPLRVESVAWVAERKDVLSGCFGLLALILYARYATGGRRSGQAPPGADVRPLAPGYYWLSLFFFALGLMSKPTLVTWPFVMLLLDYWPLRRFEVERTWRLVMEKIPFVVLAAAASVVTVVVQKQAGAMATILSLPLSARTGNALIAYCRYLGKLFWPADLAVFYPHPGQWPAATVLLAGGFLLAISGLVWALRRRFPFLLMGWLWFGGMLVPMIGLVPTGGWAMADRHTYLASLGVLVFAVWGTYELTRGWRHQMAALSVTGAVATVLCWALTRQQLGHWQDSEALFRHALRVSENNYLAHNNLGVALVNRGRTQEAIRQFHESIRLAPGFDAAHYSLGTVLAVEGHVDEAISQLREALRLRPGYANAHHSLGDALVKQGQIDEAISQYREAVRLQPDDVVARNQLGVALAKQGHVDEAIRQHQEAIRLKPDASDAHYNLANALFRKGQVDEAIGQYREALRLKPEDADIRNNFGVALWRKGRNEEAISQFREALRLKPDHADARRNLNNVLLTAQPRSSKQPGSPTRP